MRPGIGHIASPLVRCAILAFVLACAAAAALCRPGMAQPTTVDIVPNRGHSASINHVSVSQDGRLIATVGLRDPVVRLWDAATLRLVRALRVSEEEMPRIALSPDGAVLATKADEVALWNTASGAKIKTLAKKVDYGGDSESIVFAGGTRLIVESASYGESLIRDAVTGGVLKRLGSESRSVALFASPRQATFIAAVSSDYERKATRIDVYITANWAQQSSATVASATIRHRSTQLSEDGQTIWCLGDNVLSEIDVHSGRVRRSQKLAEARDYEFAGWAFSPDGKFVWVVDKNDSGLRGWDIANWRSLPALTIGTLTDSPCAFDTYDYDSAQGESKKVRKIAKVVDLAVSAANNPVVAVCRKAKNGDELLAWNAATSSRPRSSPVSLKRKDKGFETITGDANTITSDDGTRVMINWHGRALGILDLAKVELSTQALRNIDDCIVTISINAAKAAYQCADRDNTNVSFRIWEPGVPGQIEIATPNGLFERALMSPDGRYLAAARAGEYPAMMYGLIFSRNGSRFATTGVGTVDLYDTDSGERLASPRAQQRTTQLRKGQDDSQSSEFSPVYLWDSATGQLVRALDASPHKLHKVVFSGDGRLIAGGYMGRKARFQRGDGRVTVWSADTGKIVWSRKINEDGLTSLYFTPGDGSLVTTSLDGTIKELAAGTGKVLWSDKRNLGGRWTVISETAASADGRWIAEASGTITPLRVDPVDAYSQLEVLNSRGKALQCKVSGLISKIHQVAFSPDGERVIATDRDEVVRIWSTESCDLLATLYAGEDGEWVMITPEGFFAASPKGAKLLSAVRGLDLFSIDQAFDLLYRPDLVRDKLAGRKERVNQAALTLNLTQALESGRPPLVSVVSPSTGSSSREDQIAVSIALADDGGGIGRVEWRVDDVVVGIDEKVAVANGKATVTRMLPLDDGANLIEVVAYNARNIVSSTPPARIKVAWDGTATRALPTLHVLAVGIDKYWDPRLALHYAVADAKKLADAFSLAREGIYAYPVNKKILTDDQASTEGLERAFKEFASEVRPRDVFVLYVAGHGKTLDGRYHFIPHEFRYQGLDSIKTHAISQDRLRDWLSQIKARKSVTIYDTCESGTLTGEQPGARSLEQLGWLDRMVRATGRTVLAGSRGDQPAIEGYRGHGIFTYGVLDAISSGSIDEHGLVSVSALADHLDRVVPLISEKELKYKQVPLRSMSGTNFPLVRRTKVIDDDGTGPVVVPIEPTHAFLEEVDIKDQNGVVVHRATKGMRVVVLSVDPVTGKTLIGRNGRILGSFDKQSRQVLLELQ
jgi:WD40 repeat protein